MGEKQLNAWVVLGGRVDNSFQQLGTSLVTLGESVDGISQKLINFGKESVNTYRSYEDSMLEAQVALSTTYGKGTTALNNVMDELDRAASNWAATTIFHTDDVANAIAEAAHANWDLDKILTGMPAAMRLAQAGGLDLSTGLDYIIKSTNAAGISFEELESWIDEWTYAANRSAGDVEQFGEAMTKMGATMKFADNKEELLTMLAVLHDTGTTGSSAGTLLRNTMIRLISPTKKATEVMEELGVAQSDLDEALGETDGDLDAAMKILSDLGFSAYDSNGNLKDMTTIFEDLYAATSKMTDKGKLGEVWSALFPTRTITGAMALIEAAGNNWNGLLDDLNSGKAEGYGAYAAETMMSGLTGAIETFNSKVEDLKKIVGQQLAPQLETIVTNFGKVIDVIRSSGEDNGVSSGLDWLTGVSELIGSLADNVGKMDPALFDAVVAGLGGIAALGPTLVVGGLAIRGIGNALALFTGSTVGKIILTAAALSIIMTALEKYSEAKYLENFGKLNIDTTNLDASMTRIHDAFLKASEPTQAYADALRAAITNYEEAGTKFSATMMEDLLADQTLTGEKLEDKLAEYRTLGSDMVGALKEGITSSADMSAEFWAMVFKGQNGTDEELAKNELYGGILQALEDEKGEAIARAEAIGDALQAAINKAWEDGHLDESEREKIKQYFKELNAAMAEAEREAQEESDYAKRRLMMDKAQGLSYQQMDDYIKNTIEPQRQEELDWFDQHFNSEIYAMEFNREKALNKYNELMSQGRFAEAQEYGEKISQYDANIAASKEAANSYRAGIYSEYDKMIMSWYAATVADSDVSKSLPALQQAAEWLMSGQLTGIEEAASYFERNTGTGADRSILQTYYENELAALGGVEEIKNRIAEYRKSDDQSVLDMADNLEGLLAAYAILMNRTDEYGDMVQRDAQTISEFEDLFRSGYFGPLVASYLKNLLDEDIDDSILQETTGGLDSTIAGYLEGMIQAFTGEYDMSMIAALFGGSFRSSDLQDDYALAQLLGMSQEEREQYRIGGEASNYYQAMQEYLDAQSAYDEAIRRIGGEGMTTAELEAWSAELFASGEAGKQKRSEEIQEALTLQAEMELKKNALAEAQVAYNAAQEVFNTPLTGSVKLTVGFSGLLSQFGIDLSGIPQEASGGRETQPSIFAEAGKPEWYIPEEHTSNTAKLLIAAAKSSGFSMVDLASMSGAQLFAEGGTDGSGSTAALSWGSLSGSGSGGSDSGDTVAGGITVQYSPVIHANDTAGMRQELEADKKRFKQYFEELMAKKELYESIAAY